MDHTPTPLEIDWKQMWYIVTSLCLGSLSAMASLLGSDQPLAPRIIATYLISGGVASAAVIFLLVEKYGFSYFLCGAGILAGYKATDVLAILSYAIAGFTRKFLVKHSPVQNVPPECPVRDGEGQPPKEG